MPEQPPYLDTSLDNGVLVLTVTRRQIEGEELAKGLKDEMEAAVARAAATKVVVDLHQARYVSSIAFWPLLALRRQLAERGGRLLICGLTGTVEEVFTMTKMISTGGTSSAPFEVAPDRASAVARLVGTAPRGA